MSIDLSGIDPSIIAKYSDNDFRSVRRTSSGKLVWGNDRPIKDDAKDLVFRFRPDLKSGGSSPPSPDTNSIEDSKPSMSGKVENVEDRSCASKTDLASAVKPIQEGINEIKALLKKGSAPSSPPPPPPPASPPPPPPPTSPPPPASPPPPPDEDEASSGPVAAIAGAVSSAGGKVVGAATEIKDKAIEEVESLKEKVTGSGSVTSEAASKASDKVTGAATEVKEKVVGSDSSTAKPEVVDASGKPVPVKQVVDSFFNDPRAVTVNNIGDKVRPIVQEEVQTQIQALNLTDEHFREVAGEVFDEKVTAIQSDGGMTESRLMRLIGLLFGFGVLITFIVLYFEPRLRKFNIPLPRYWPTMNWLPTLLIAIIIVAAACLIGLLALNTDSTIARRQAKQANEKANG